jgi:hypothetical protein
MNASFFEAYAQMREISVNAKRMTKAARREEQRRRAQTNHTNEVLRPGVTELADDLADDISQLEPFEVEEM